MTGKEKRGERSYKMMKQKHNDNGNDDDDIHLDNSGTVCTCLSLCCYSGHTGSHRSSRFNSRTGFIFFFLFYSSPFFLSQIDTKVVITIIIIVQEQSRDYKQATRGGNGRGVIRGDFYGGTLC